MSWPIIILCLTLLSCLAGANDKFEDRIHLSGELPLSSSSTHVGATGGEIHSDRPSRWWTWTATQSGWHELRVESNPSTSSHIYQGSSLYQLLTVVESPVSVEGEPTKLPFLAEAGETYQIAIVGISTQDPAPFTVQLLAIPFPSPNDHFKNSIDLGEALDVTIHARNYGATAEQDEPHHGSRRPKASVWWSFAPNNSQSYRVKFSLPDYFSPRLSLYEGTSLDKLVLVKTFSIFISEGWSGEQFETEVGKQYHLAMDQPTFFGAVDSQLTIQLEAIPPRESSPPVNDNFADATDLGAVREISFSAKFEHATREQGYGEQLNDTGAFLVRLLKTSWWRWKCPETGSYALAPNNGDSSSYDYLKIAIEKPNGDLEERSLRPIKGELIEAIAGEKFYFMTGTLWNDRIDPISFQLKKITPSLNRDESTAIQLGSVEQFQLAGETFTDGGSPLTWKWNPNSTGNYRLLPSAPWAFPRFTIHETNAEGESSEIHRIQNGDYYQIRADSSYLLSLTTQPSFATLTGYHLPASTNDHFADAIDLGKAHYTRSKSSTYGASIEPNEPWTSYTKSLWWRWEAPETGTWNFTQASDSPIEIFQGSDLDNLQNLARGSYLKVNQGEIYFIRLTAHAEKEQQLNISRGVPTLNDLRADSIDLGDGPFVEARGGYTQATAEPDEPGSRNLWWRWTAPSTGFFSLRSSGFKERTKIYQGALDSEFSNLLPVETSILGGSVETLVFSVKQGQHYSIISYKDAQNIGGTGLLSIAPFQAPTGDSFEDRIDLGTAKVTRHLGFGQNSTLSAFDPSTSQFLSGSIWMTWKAPATGIFRIEGQSPQEDRGDDGIGVYTGDDPTTLSLVALAVEDDEEEQSITSFSATEGTSYQIVFFSDVNFENFEVKITPSRSYELWMKGWQKHLSSLSILPLDELDTSRERSPRNDGISNFTKYVFGLNPTNDGRIDFQLRNLPTLTVTDQNLELKYRLGLDASLASIVTIRHFGEWSRDGETWERIEPTPLGSNWFVTTTPIDGDIKLMRMRAYEE